MFIISILTLSAFSLNSREFSLAHNMNIFCSDAKQGENVGGMGFPPPLYFMSSVIILYFIFLEE